MLTRFFRSTKTSAGGFTLIELCWTMAIFAIVAGAGVAPLHNWAAAERMRSTSSEIEAVLRETQQRSITEGRMLCIDFDLSTQSWTVFRGSCGSAGLVRIEGPIRPSDGVRIAAAVFTYAGGTTRSGITFYPRGTASPGTLRVTRDQSDHADLLVVDGLTGRVSRG